MYSSLPVKYQLFLSHIMKLEFSQQIFEKYSNMKFHENLFNADGWTDRRTDMTKLIAAYAILIVRLKMVSYCLCI